MRPQYAYPAEHKTVQARILKYAQEIRVDVCARDEAEKRRGLDATGAQPEEHSRKGKVRNVISFRLVIGYNEK